MVEISEASGISSIPNNGSIPELNLEEFRFVIDFMPQMVWTTHPSGYHDYYNQRWYEFTELSFEETKDKGWSLVLHPEDYEHTWNVWKHSLDTGTTYEIEYRMRKFDGTYHWFLARAKPLRDKAGKILKWFGTCTNIQEQRETLDELEQTREKLKISNLELSHSNEELSRINLELDNFVYSASHDLKAPLNNMEGLVGLLETDGRTHQEQKDIIKMLAKSITRFKSVINDISFMVQTAKADQRTQHVDLPTLINDLQSDLAIPINSTNATISLDLNILEIQYIRKEIRSILYNLISNGLKYRHPKRTPKIWIRSRRLPEGVLIEVEDNGCGIKQKHLSKLFDKYYRVKSSAEGSGLGLFIVKRMVENRGGQIKVTSLIGEGTKFSLSLKTFMHDEEEIR